MANTLTLGTFAIRALNGLFSLNDLHKAAGGAIRHQPTRFMRLDQTQALVAEINSPDVVNKTEPEIQKGGITPFAVVKGRNGGTYACRELVIAYAAWISAAFHLKVIRVFLDAGDAAKATPAPIAPSFKNRRWLTSIDSVGHEVTQPVPDGALMVTFFELAEAIADGGMLATSAELTQLAAACTKRLAARLGSQHKPSQP